MAVPQLHEFHPCVQELPDRRRLIISIDTRHSQDFPESGDMRRVNVLYLIDSLGAGGAETSLAQSLPLLEKQGVRTKIICLKNACEGVTSDVLDGGGSVVELPNGAWHKKTLSIRQMINAEKPDLLHTTLFSANIAGRLGAVKTGVPVITSLVSTPYVPIRFQDPNITRWKLRVVQAVDAITARKLTTHFHALTHAVKDAAISSLGLDPDAISVIPRGRSEASMGICSKERRQKVRETLSIPESSPLLINVGRNEFPKGQLILLDAFEEVSRQWPDSFLLIVGRTGNQTAELTERIHKSEVLRSRVRLCGHRRDVADLLAASDIFVFPSLYEGLGGALIEAMAMQLPIVASRIPAIQEVLEENGNANLASPGNAHELAESVLDLMKNPAKRTQYARRGREIFDSQFRLEAVIDKMADLYRRVASHR